jgi:hypothetical protein
MFLGVFRKLGTVALILLSNSLLEGVADLGLLQEVAKALENSAELCAGFPSFGLEEAKADVALAVVCDVGVIDSSDELDDRRLEGVFNWQGQDDSEFAWVVGS